MSEDSSSKKRFKFIPSIKHLQTAAAELPAAKDCPYEEQSVDIKVGSSARTLVFRVIEMTMDGEKQKRWIYEGKVRI